MGVVQDPRQTPKGDRWGTGQIPAEESDRFTLTYSLYFKPWVDESAVIRSDPGDAVIHYGLLLAFDASHSHEFFRICPAAVAGRSYQIPRRNKGSVTHCEPVTFGHFCFCSTHPTARGNLAFPPHSAVYWCVGGRRARVASRSAIHESEKTKHPHGGTEFDDECRHAPAAKRGGLDPGL